MGIIKLRDNWHLWLTGAAFAFFAGVLPPVSYITDLVFLLALLLLAYAIFPLYIAPQLTQHGRVLPTWLDQLYPSRSGMLPGLLLAIVAPFVCGYLAAFLLIKLL